MNPWVQGPKETIAVRQRGRDPSDSLAREVDELLSSETGRTRWLDLCFRLIILALAALWLLAPPAGRGHEATDGKAIATTP